jgi:amphi-Trp domain-containing protein
MARALGRGEPVPATDDQTVTVDVPAETEFEVEVEREAGDAVLEVELSWPDEGGETIETEATRIRGVGRGGDDWSGYRLETVLVGMGHWSRSVDRTCLTPVPQFEHASLSMAT